MNVEEENAILKRQLTVATTALTRILSRSQCENPIEGCPRFTCPHELSRNALGDILKLAVEKPTPADWGVRIEEAGKGWKATFFVENQSFTLCEDQDPDEDEDALARATFFRAMFLTALSRMGVDTSTAKSL